MAIAERVERVGQGTLTMEDVPDTITDEEVVNVWNSTIDSLDPERIIALIVDADRSRNDIHRTAQYEGIFVTPGLSRRSERPVWQYQAQPAFTLVMRIEQYVGKDQVSFMRGWLNACKAQTNYADRHVVPNNMDHFAAILREYMPARLSVDSWIAVAALPAMSFTLNLNPNMYHEFCEWQPRFGEGGIRDGVRSGRSGYTFIGPAAPGRLVWWKPTGFDPERPSMQGLTSVVEDLRRFEMALVALGRRIANQVAMKIVRDYALPQALEHQRPSLDRSQIECAVKEILGRAWFDLPFDTENQLRHWSIDEVLKPNDQMNGSNVFTDREQVR